MASQCEYKAQRLLRPAMYSHAGMAPKQMQGGSYFPPTSPFASLSQTNDFRRNSPASGGVGSSGGSYQGSCYQHSSGSVSVYKENITPQKNNVGSHPALHGHAPQNPSSPKPHVT